MQIHELNNYSGSLDSGAYLAVDNGNDTGKVSASGLLNDVTNAISEASSSLNARIDNIIAGGTAPSEAEVTDARLGADGTTYSSLGDAIRDQIRDANNDLFIATDAYLSNSVELMDTDRTIDGYYPSAAGGGAGQLFPNASAGSTDWIYVRPIDRIIITPQTGGAHNIVFYNKNKQYVTGLVVTLTADSPYTYDIPYSNHPDIYYARIAFYLTEKTTFSIVGIDTTESDNRFASMKMNCLGDSITWGYIPDSGARMANPYPSIVKNLLGLSECRNYGISGSTLAVNSGNYDPMCIRYADMDDDADIVLVFGGTNDYGRAVYTPNLGTITDSVNTTVYGALNILCDGLITKYPKALIFLCTPLKRADKTAANGGGYTLEDVAKAIRDVGEKFGMPVLDLNYEGGFYISNAAFRSQYGGDDKLHPNQAFNTDHLAPMVARYVNGKI